MVMAGLEEKLREKRLKITPQRLEVLRAIRYPPHHFSAEAIYQRVKRRYPSVSLATVYKTLDTLIEIGEIRIALVTQGKTIYDRRMDPHHHFVCSVCAKIHDVDRNLICIKTCLPESLSNECRVERSEVLFHGVCSTCNANSSESLEQVQSKSSFDIHSH